MNILRPILLAVASLFILAQTAQAHYDPNIGRWISRDPIGETGGVNLYEAVRNNPMRWYDYLGLDPRPVDGGFGFTGQQDHPGNNLDHTWADTAGGPNEIDNPNLGQGTSGKEILDHLEKLSKENCCVRRYTIAGHGRGAAPPEASGHAPGKSSIPSSDFPTENGFYGPGDEYWGAARGPTARTTDDLKSAIADGKIKFCKPCVIQIHGCNLAGIVQPLSRVTGCRVIAAGGYCSFGKKRSWASDDYNSENGTKGAGDQFWESTNGSDPMPIGHSFTPQIQGPVR